MAKGEKIMANMQEQYGSDKKAKEVFYASKNAGKISGVDSINAECKRVEATVTPGKAKLVHEGKMSNVLKAHDAVELTEGQRKWAKNKLGANATEEEMRRAVEEASKDRLNYSSAGAKRGKSDDADSLTPEEVRQRQQYYTKALKEGKITEKEYSGFMEALGRLYAGVKRKQVADAVGKLAERFDSFLVRRRSGFKTRHDATIHTDPKVAGEERWDIRIERRDGSQDHAILSAANQKEAIKKSREYGRFVSVVGRVYD